MKGVKCQVKVAAGQECWTILTLTSRVNWTGLDKMILRHRISITYMHSDVPIANNKTSLSLSVNNTACILANNNDLPQCVNKMLKERTLMSGSV